MNLAPVSCPRNQIQLRNIHPALTFYVSKLPPESRSIGLLRIASEALPVSPSSSLRPERVVCVLRDWVPCQFVGTGDLPPHGAVRIHQIPAPCSLENRDSLQRKSALDSQGAHCVGGEGRTKVWY